MWIDRWVAGFKHIENLYLGESSCSRGSEKNYAGSIFCLAKKISTNIFFNPRFVRNLWSPNAFRETCDFPLSKKLTDFLELTNRASERAFPTSTILAVTELSIVITLIYLWSREGGTPPTQRTNLRFAQIVEDLKNFNFGRPMPHCVHLWKIFN